MGATCPASALFPHVIEYLRGIPFTARAAVEHALHGPKVFDQGRPVLMLAESPGVTKEYEAVASPGEGNVLCRSSKAVSGPTEQGGTTKHRCKWCFGFVCARGIDLFYGVRREMTSEGRSQESRRVAFQLRFRSEFVFKNNSPLFSLHFILSKGIDRG